MSNSTRVALPAEAHERFERLVALHQDLSAQRYRNQNCPVHRGTVLAYMETKDWEEYQKTMPRGTSVNSIMDMLLARVNPSDRPGAFSNDLRRRFPRAASCGWVIEQLLDRNANDIEKELDDALQDEIRATRRIRPQYI